MHARWRVSPMPAEYDSIRRNIERHLGEWPAERIIVEMQHMLASLGDGHTLLFPFGMRTGSMKRLPMTLYRFAEGMYVTGSSNAALNGARVTRSTSGLRTRRP